MRGRMQTKLTLAPNLTTFLTAHDKTWIYYHEFKLGDDAK